MTFDVAGDAYDRFMGRYSVPLAERFSEWADPRPGQRALDVGAGTGALTAQLVGRLGAGAVSAIDPSLPFLSTLRARFPGVDVQEGSAEQIPYPDDFFDQTLAQLVVHFMRDPVAGVGEMARVTKPGGLVATCVWDFGGERGPLSLMWRAARDLDPGIADESDLPGVHERDLIRISDAADLADIEHTALTITVTSPTFADWWEPYQFGVGPAGEYIAGLEPDHRQALADRCRELLGPEPITVTAVAWAVRGRV